MQSSKINIAYVIWSLGLGGAEQVVINLAKGLDKTRFEVIVCCLNDQGTFAESVQKDGIKIYALNKKRGIDFSVIPKLMKIFREQKIVIVHTHLWGANTWGRLAAKLAGIPVIIATEHNVDVWKKWYHRFIDRIVSLGTDKIIVVSGEVKKFYRQTVGISERKLHLVYNGIEPKVKETNVTQLNKLKFEFGISRESIVLSNIGRLVEAKANHIFIEALEILDREAVFFHALIVGDGPLKEILEKKGKHLVDQKKLTFTGLRKDVDRILDITDISVLSSTREGFSIVILESMAHGIPVVATNVGGNHELIIDSETGFLVEPNSPVALANAIRKIIDQKFFAKMGEQARQRVDTYFSLKQMIRYAEEIYTDWPMP